MPGADLTSAAPAGKMPTVIQVIPELSAGGAERGCVDVANAIVQAGGTSIVVSEGGRLVQELVAKGSRFVEMPVASKNPLKIRANAKAMAMLIRNSGAQIIHARSRAPAWSAQKAALQTGINFVTTYHGTYNAGSSAKRFYNSVMAKGAKVIAVSNFIARHVVDQHGSNDQIVTIPRGINPDVFNLESVPDVRKIQLLCQWGLEDDPRKIILLPGRLTRWKGQGLLVEAVALLAKRRQDFVCIMPGDAQGRNKFVKELQDMIDKNDLGNLVRLPGHLNDISAAYALCDIVVCPSLEPEAFGRVPVEAQAMEKPVVAADHGGASETVEQGLTGFLIPPGDAEVLAAALDGVLDLDRAERSLMGKAGRARVLDRYTVDRMCADTLKLYRDVAGA